MVCLNISRKVCDLGILVLWMCSRRFVKIPFVGSCHGTQSHCLMLRDFLDAFEKELFEK